MNPNVLRWLAQYDQQGMGAQGGGYSGGFDPYGVLDFANKMNGANRAGARTSWAERMAAQEGGSAMPDFFGPGQADGPSNALTGYSAPRRMDAESMMPPPRAPMARPTNVLNRYRMGG